jgi:hypothetical protein
LWFEFLGTPYAELQSIDINLQELRTGNQKLREMIENMEKEQNRLSDLKVVYEVISLRGGIYNI